MARSFAHGKPCDKCMKPLDVEATDPSTTYSFQGDEYVHSVYVCQGEDRHRWQDDPLLYGGSVLNFNVISIEED